METNNGIPAETLKFLEILKKKPDETRIRLINNPRSKGKGAEKAIMTPEKIAEWSKRQASIYAVVNHGGDHDVDITGCVGLYMEHDTIPKSQQLVCWQGILPPPSLQVDTGGKSIHQYWVLNSILEPERWRILTEHLIRVFGSDPSIKNPSRVMRLPGFRYFDKEGNPGGMCSIVNDNHPTYEIEELETALYAALPPLPQKLNNQWFRKGSSDSDWGAANPCPICGRDLDEKCRMTKDGGFIHCHVGDTFAPPEVLKGKLLKGHDGQHWKRKGATTNVFGPAVGFELVESESEQSGSTKQLSKKELIAFLRQHYGSRLAWNELKKRVELDGKVVDDLDLMHCKLAEDHGIEQNAATVRDTVLYASKANAYHSVQEFLLEAEKESYDTPWIEIGSEYLGLRSSIESKMFGIHLLASVYRAFQPGYPYDCMAILKGPQGIGKTRTIKILAGASEHYISSAAAQQDKDFLLQVGTCWHCELEEIDGHIDSRHEAQLKALISRHTDNYRPPYGRNNADFPRPSVLTGTTNQHQFLVDVTGNRRFMIIDMKAPVNLDRLEFEVKKIWSAVMAAYRQGQEPRLTKAEQQEAAEIAAKSMKEDPWLGQIEASVQGTPVVFTHQILRSVLEIESKSLKIGRSSEQRRVSDCLTALGYTLLQGQAFGLNRAAPGNSGWPERTRGVWFAPGILPTTNGQEIVDLLNAAGKVLVPGPSFNPAREHDAF
jgi:predicted P-loop ATPase